MAEQTEIANESDSTILLLLAALLNRVGGSTIITSSELEDNVMRSAVEFTVVRGDDGEPEAVSLRTMDNDDAMAVYQEFNV